MNIKKTPSQIIRGLFIITLSLLFFSLTHADEPYAAAFPFEEDMLVLDVTTVVHLALNNSDQLFDAQSGIRVADLFSEVTQAEFDLIISPRGDSGYIGGGSAGYGVTIGGGVDFEKKLPVGARISINPSLLKAADKYHSNFQARFSQPLLRGFGREYNMAGVRMSQFAQRTAQRTFYKSMSQIILRAIELLYDVAKQKELVQLHADSYKRLLLFWNATKTKERIGLSNALDVYRAEMELKQAEDALSQSKEALQDAGDFLRSALGLPQEAKFTVAVSLDVSSEEWDLEGAAAMALGNRIEIDQGLDQIEENRRLRRLAEEELRPSLNLVVDYSNVGYGEEFTGSFGRKRESRWGIGFTSSTDGCRVREKSSYEKALIGEQAAKKALAEIKKAIVLDVKRTRRALFRAREKILLQRDQVKSLEGGLHLAKAKFLRQYATSFDVIQAEKAFHVAQLSLICALIDHKVGEYRLKTALGLLIENNFKCL